jgi:hypothetical protein
MSFIVKFCVKHQQLYVFRTFFECMSFSELESDTLNQSELNENNENS